jgi:putative methyltransferase
MVDAQLGPAHPRWIRVNAIKSSLDEQLDTTFKGFEIVPTVADVMSPASAGRKLICLDAHVPNLVAASPGMDFTKTSAYKSGAIILQDKASCFPAYLLDPRPEDGDIIDACSAPGNKTTHLTAILHERGFARGQKIFAFEKDKQRAKTLEKMLRTAGSDSVTVIYPGHDFLKTDPNSPEFRNVGALLLDPSCSGSGIVGRDDAPQFHLPALTNPPSTSSDASNNNNGSKSRKRKRRADVKQTGPEPEPGPGTDTEPESEKDLQTRLSALASFQLAMVVHALSFPAAKKVSYSTCSIHAEENEQVVAAALRSEVARRRGWRVLRREEQVRGMAEWPVRGQVFSSSSTPGSGDGGELDMDSAALEGCVRAEAGDGRGVMGFFVVCFVRNGVEKDRDGDPDGPFLRDAQGRIVRDVDGIPFLKSTGERAFALQEDENDGSPMELRFAEDGDGDDGDGPFERDAQGRIIRNADGLPRLKTHRVEEQEEEEGGGDDDEWGGFDD